MKIDNYYRTKEDTLPVCFYEIQAQVDSFYKHEKIHKMKTVDWISTNLVKVLFSCAYNTSVLIIIKYAQAKLVKMHT